LRLALFQPDIPQNVGAAIRVAACFGASIDIIGPYGFAGGEREMRRVAMDYAPADPVVLHASWSAFLNSLLSDGARSARLVLMTTRGDGDLWSVAFAPDDVIILGRESAGVPDDVRAAANLRLRIPLAKGARSLNVATAGAVALAEARRQLGY
jgi:tRNA (cytidine/uridine-2'-O-)-methyltransferase